MNRKYFYDTLRTSLFKGKISEEQFEGMEAILNEYGKRKWTDLRKLAYIFATVFHETAGTMQPIEEFGKGKGKSYGQKLKMGGGPGKRIPYVLPDKIYFGRGHVQTTWYENYERLTKAAKAGGYDWDFLNKPELLLQMEPSVWATFHGMEAGIYTGKKLSDYFFGSFADYFNARKIINGLDKAKEIERYAKLFAQGFLPSAITHQ
jgi:putative chitinase